MEDIPLSQSPVSVNMRNTSTRSMITLVTSSTASYKSSSYCRKNDPIFGLESEIDEDIATEDALVIDDDGGDSDVEGDEFELHMNENETEYQRRTVFQNDRQYGPMVSILMYTKVQNKSMK